MPNWIKNELAVYNLDLIGKTALEVAFGHDRPFQRLYPMPKILEETQSPTPRCIEEILGKPARNASSIPDGFEFFASSVSKSDLKHKILERGVDEVVSLIREDKTLDDHDVSKAELAVTAIVKTGYANWYDWCVDNWGVKWDVDTIFFMHADESPFKDDEKSEPDLIIEFETPWAPPVGILKRISEQYPEARFYLRWADEFGPGNGVGLLVAEAGLIDERDIDDEKDFFDKLWFGRDS